MNETEKDNEWKIEISREKFSQIWQLLQDASCSVPLADTQTQEIIDRAEMLLHEVAQEFGVNP